MEASGGESGVRRPAPRGASWPRSQWEDRDRSRRRTRRPASACARDKSKRPIITCYGHAEQRRQGTHGEDETPAAGELPRPHPVQRVLVQRVLVAAQAEAVHPREHHVAVVAVDRGERQERDT